MELMESGIVRENHPCRHKGRIEFKVKKETSKILVGKGDEPMNRLQDLIGVEMTQKLGREAEQLSQRAEQTPILMNLQLNLRVEQTPILKDLELSRRVEHIPILRDLGTVLKDLDTILKDLDTVLKDLDTALKDLGTVVMDLTRMRRMG